MKKSFDKDSLFYIFFGLMIYSLLGSLIFTMQDIVKLILIYFKLPVFSLKITIVFFQFIYLALILVGIIIPISLRDKIKNIKISAAPVIIVFVGFFIFYGVEFSLNLVCQQIMFSSYYKIEELGNFSMFSSYASIMSHVFSLIIIGIGAMVFFFKKN